MQYTTENKTVKRLTPRNSIEAAVTCRPFASSSALRASDGIMRNFSCNGSYIETACEFKPGTILIVRMARYPSLPSSLAAEGWPRTICLAEVKWREELADVNTIRFGMGLRNLG